MNVCVRMSPRNHRTTTSRHMTPGSTTMSSTEFGSATRDLVGEIVQGSDNVVYGSEDINQAVKTRKEDVSEV